MANDPGIIMVIVTVLGVGVALGTLILTAIHRAESRLNRRIDALELNTKRDIADFESRTSAEIKASESRTSAEIKASESRTSAKFEEVREQFGAMHAHTSAGFADTNDQLRTANARMSSIEQRQARLEGLLDGLREALFERVRQ